MPFTAAARTYHLSICALCRAPAYEPGPCDCGAEPTPSVDTMNDTLSGGTMYHDVGYAGIAEERGAAPRSTPSAATLRPGTILLVESHSRKMIWGSGNGSVTHRELAALEVAAIRSLRAKRLRHGLPLTKSSLEAFHLENLAREHRLHGLVLRERAARGFEVRPSPLAAE